VEEAGFTACAGPHKPYRPTMGTATNDDYLAMFMEEFDPPPKDQAGSDPKINENKDLVCCRLDCLLRLRKITLVIGPERVCKELLPYLENLLKENDEQPSPEALGDEVLTQLAQELGNYAPLVGEGQAYKLLNCLIMLCHVDETTVRGDAIKAIKGLIKKKHLSPQQVFQHLAPSVLALSRDKTDKGQEWFDCLVRVSACELIAVAYEGCKAAATGTGKPTVKAIPSFGSEPKEMTAEDMMDALLNVFRFCINGTEGRAEELMVKRAAAKEIGEVAQAVANETKREELLRDLWCTLVAEKEQESIRVAALESARFLVKAGDTKEYGSVWYWYSQCSADKSWRVKKGVCETLEGVAKELRGDEAATEQCQSIFKALIECSDPEVKNAMAKQSAQVAQVWKGTPFVEDEIFPKILDLALNRDADKQGDTNRADFTRVLLQLAGPLGEEAAIRLLLKSKGSEPSVIKSLVNDDNDTNVSLAAMAELVTLIDTVSLSKADDVIAEIAELCAVNNWRIRHKAMTLLPELATRMDVDKFNERFVDGKNGKYGESFIKRAQDNCALIRLEFVTTCVKIGGSYEESRWIENNIVEVIEKAADEKNYQFKAVLLDAAPKLAPLLKDSNTLKEKFIPKMLDMLSNQVPNLRLLSAKGLGLIIHSGLCEKSYTESNLIPALQKAKDDQDPDVSGCVAEFFDSYS